MLRQLYYITRGGVIKQTIQFTQYPAATTALTYAPVNMTNNYLYRRKQFVASEDMLTVINSAYCRSPVIRQAINKPYLHDTFHSAPDRYKLTRHPRGNASEFLFINAAQSTDK